MTTRMIGTGSFLPETVVTNDYLSTLMETSDEWIVSRTGIKERRLVKEETTASMSIEAAKRAMEDAGVTPEEIDLIIVGTISGDYVTPSTACEVQAGIGAYKATAFDINAACSGFVFALHTAHAYLQCNMATTALIIGAETLSKIMDWTDRSTCVLFGDGAGAAIVRKDNIGILSIEQGSDGSKGMALACRDRENNNPLIQNPIHMGYVSMEGQEVYKFAVSTVPVCIQKALLEANLTTEDIKYYILHQANQRIIQSIAKRLKENPDKFPISLDHCGNISAGSIPILLDEVNKQGKLNKGDRIVLAGFGGGLTWATTVLEW